MKPANSFSFKLHSLTYTVDKLANKIIKENSDINFPQFFILLCVTQHPGQSQKFAASWLQVTEATVSHMVSKMAKLNLISIKEHTKDTRKKKIYATLDGKNLVNNIYPLMEQELAKHLSVISKDRLEQMITDFSSMKQSIDKNINNKEICNE